MQKHLLECENCRQIYSQANSNLIIQKTDFYTTDIDNERLSAYIDNELSDLEAVKVRKAAITNPNIRMQLENMYKIKTPGPWWTPVFSCLKTDCKMLLYCMRSLVPYTPSGAAIIPRV